MLDRVVIWGTGDISERLQMLDLEFEVIAYTDNSSEKWGSRFAGHPILPPSDIVELEFDYIIIANIYAYDAIYNTIQSELRVPTSKIKNFNDYMAFDLSKYNCGDIVFPEKYVNPIVAIKNHEIELANDLERAVFDGDYVITKYLHYFEIYNSVFSRFKNTNVRILEIGVYKGGSLYMWSNYFGPQAKIVGIDINPLCKQYENAEHNVFIESGSQTDTNFLRDIVNKYGPFDVVIDDGSHMSKDQITSFELLFPLLNENGIYLCEDVQTSYDNDYGKDDSGDTFIEYAKKIIDDMHCYHIKNGVTTRKQFNAIIHSIQFYNNIVVVNKRFSPRPITFVGNNRFFHIPMANEIIEDSDTQTK